LLLALGRDEQAQAVRWIALIGAVVELRWSRCRCTRASTARHGRHAVRRRAPWIERFNVNYHLGVDGISLWFVPADGLHHDASSVIAGWEVITERVNQYMGAFLILSGPDDRRVLARWTACCSTCSSRPR